MRMKIFMLVVLLNLFGLHKVAYPKSCTSDLLLNGIMTYQVDTFFNPGDSIDIWISAATHDPGGCQCHFDTINSYWSHNGIIVYGISIHALDTGNYHFLYFENSTFCGTNIAAKNFYIGFNISSSISEVNSSIGVSLYPSFSTGIFKINSSAKSLRRILVSDSKGNQILCLTNNDFEIDLTNFSSGIYFYAITDEKENVWRGKVVKQ
jgi:hypothetical protein